MTQSGREPGSGASETLILFPPERTVRYGRALYYEAFLFTISDFRFAITLSVVSGRPSVVYLIYLPIAAMLLPNILTAMAINITPKNFLTTINPLGPNARSIQFNDFKTIKMTTQLISIPIKILTS